MHRHGGLRAAGGECLLHPHVGLFGIRLGDALDLAVAAGTDVQHPAAAALRPACALERLGGAELTAGVAESDDRLKRRPAVFERVRQLVERFRHPFVDAHTFCPSSATARASLRSAPASAVQISVWMSAPSAVSPAPVFA